MTWWLKCEMMIENDDWNVTWWLKCENDDWKVTWWLKCETCGIKYKDCDCFLEYKNFKGDLIDHKILCCNKNYQKSLMKT